MDIKVDIGSEVAKLEDFTRQVTGRQLLIATSRAINKTLMQGRTEARKAVKSKYNIPQSQMKLIGAKTSTPNNLSGFIFASGKPIALDALQAKFSTPTKTMRITKRGQAKIKERKRRNNNPGKGTFFSWRSGEWLNIPYAFMIPGKSRVYARGVYTEGVSKFAQRNKREQKTGSDTHINTMMGPTVYQAIINKEVFERLKAKVTTVFPRIMKHELEYIINKAKKSME